MSKIIIEKEFVNSEGTIVILSLEADYWFWARGENPALVGCLHPWGKSAKQACENAIEKLGELQEEYPDIDKKVIKEARAWAEDASTITELLERGGK